MFKFSVLMSIYYRENPSALSMCFESLCIQSVPATEVILVCDGPICDKLEAVIEEFSLRLPLILVRLDSNRGLGFALNIGLQKCRYDWVARMDTDDICVPDRFRIQIEFLTLNPHIRVLGGFVEEFQLTPSDSLTLRRVPLDHISIARFARTRNPVNHMTVMFNRDAVLRSNSYQPLIGFEDYYLWVRMLVLGFQFANLDSVLVYARVGNGMFARRGGLNYVASEFDFLWRCYRLGFFGFWRMVVNVTLRTFVRVLPDSVRVNIYRLFLRGKKG